MESKLTAREWAKEIENKFVLFFELFNDYHVTCQAKARGNDISVLISAVEDINLNLPKFKKAIKSALSMAARGCPYEYSYEVK